MGEIADMMIDGTLDWETGEFIDGDSPGHPRTARDAVRAKASSGGGPRCPHCNRRCKSAQGVLDHIRAKHTGDNQ